MCFPNVFVSSAFIVKTSACCRLQFNVIDKDDTLLYRVVDDVMFYVHVSHAPVGNPVRHHLSAPSLSSRLSLLSSVGGVMKSFNWRRK